MNIMRVQEIRCVNQNRLEYSYTIEGEWSKYFEPGNPMWVEYSQPVDQVPDSVAVLPLVGNVIVLASLMDADIYVDEIDRDFYECIEEFIRGYDNIMPDHVHFKHRDIVHANKIVDTPLSQTEQEENLLFFSGGVDATFSLITHLEEKPALVTIWGADIPWDNEESWKQAIGFNQEVADRYDLKMLTACSNFRLALNDDNVNEYSLALVNDWWWHAFHHSVAMMCIAAPLTSGKRKILYFGSTFSSKDEKNWGPYTIASDPQIDNYVRFCGCQVIHDGYAFSRHEKVQRICEYYNCREEKTYLRVCFLSDTGTNCGRCAKCTRTIMDILLSGGDPYDYGFQDWEEDFDIHFAAGLQETARSKRKYNFMSNFKHIQIAYRNKYPIQQVPPVLRAFYEVDLEILADFLHVPNNECITRDKVAREFQDQLFQQIGQLKYEAKMNLQSSEDYVSSLSADLVRSNAEKQILNAEIDITRNKIHVLEKRLQQMEQSTSWRVTKPLRFAGKLLRKCKTQFRVALSKKENDHSRVS